MEHQQQTQDVLDRIASVEKRLTSLQALGLDTVALRSQLAHARTRLLEGAIDDAGRMCDEIQSKARHMANTQVRNDLQKAAEMLRSEINTLRNAPAENPSPENKSDLSSECQATLAAAVKELSVISGAISGALIGQREQNDALASAMREGFATMGQAVSASCSHQEIAETRVVLQAGLDRIVQTLEQRSVATVPISPEVAPDPTVSVSASSAERVAEKTAEIEANSTSSMHSEEPPVVSVEDLVSTRMPESSSGDFVSSAVGDATVRREAIKEISDSLDSIAMEDDMPVIIEDDGTSRLLPTHDDSLSGRHSLTSVIAEHESTHFTHQVPTEKTSSGTGSRGSRVTSRREVNDDIKRLIDEELRRSLSGYLRLNLGQILPELLKEPAAAQQIFSLIAMEAVAHPGVLGELTGLRGFLQRELKIAVEALAKDLQPV